MTKVVLDTSCISTFIRIDGVNLLVKILESNEIFITEQIAQELKLSKIEVLRNFNHQKIKIKSADSSIAEKYNIHIGEASVIMFAKKNNAFAIIDDKKARQAAIKEGIDFIGTATLIKLGIERKIIKKEEIEKILEEITTKGKLYLSEEIIAWLME